MPALLPFALLKAARRFRSLPIVRAPARSARNVKASVFPARGIPIAGVTLLVQTSFAWLVLEVQAPALLLTLSNTVWKLPSGRAVVTFEVLFRDVALVSDTEV